MFSLIVIGPNGYIFFDQIFYAFLITAAAAVINKKVKKQMAQEGEPESADINRNDGRDLDDRYS